MKELLSNMRNNLTKIDDGYVYLMSFKFHFPTDGFDYHFYKVGSSTNVENRAQWILDSIKSNFNIQNIEYELIDSFYTNRAYFYEKDIHFLSKFDIWKFKDWAGVRKSKVSGKTEFFKATNNVLYNYYSIKEEALLNTTRVDSLKQIEIQKKVAAFKEKQKEEEKEDKKWEEEYRKNNAIENEKNKKSNFIWNSIFYIILAIVFLTLIL